MTSKDVINDDALYLHVRRLELRSSVVQPETTGNRTDNYSGRIDWGMVAVAVLEIWGAQRLQNDRLRPIATNCWEGAAGWCDGAVIKRWEGEQVVTSGQH